MMINKSTVALLLCFREKKLGNCTVYADAMFYSLEEIRLDDRQL